MSNETNCIGALGTNMGNGGALGGVVSHFDFWQVVQADVKAWM